MHMGWVPSELFYSMLPRHQIPREFVDTCLDEFILYYIDKERKESNWDQKFLAWVKREWVQKQTREAKTQRHELKNGILYLKGGDLSEELKTYQTATIYKLTDYYEDDFFETKKVVHLPLKFKG